MKKELAALKKPFYFLTCIYCLSLTALIRVNYLYKDDIGRVIDGHRNWIKGSRQLNDLISIILNMDFRLDDLAPMTQLLAAVIMAAATVIVLKLFSHGEKIRWVDCVAAVPFALNPFFLQCFSFRYDAPYMALSVFAAVCPFLFVGKGRIAFWLSSVVGVLVMCLTYQTSSGIYPMLVLFYIFDQWNRKEMSVPELLKFTVPSVGCYLASLAFYRLIFVRSTAGYTSTAVFSLAGMPKGIFRNYRRFYAKVKGDLKIQWLFLIAVLILLFLLVMVVHSKQNRLLAAAAAGFSLAAGSFLTYGIFLVQKKPVYMPRMLYGFGVLIAILSILTVRTAKLHLSAVVPILLSWCFFIFCFVYGNALGQQADYTQLRLNVLISDLNSLDIMKNGQIKNIQFENNLPKAPAVKAASENYKILPRLIPCTLGKYTWARYYFYEYLNIPDIQHDKTISLKDQKDSLPVLKDTPYHTIRGEADKILITLKP